MLKAGLFALFGAGLAALHWGLGLLDGAYDQDPKDPDFGVAYSAGMYRVGRVGALGGLLIGMPLVCFALHWVLALPATAFVLWQLLPRLVAVLKEEWARSDQFENRELRVRFGWLLRWSLLAVVIVPAVFVALLL